MSDPILSHRLIGDDNAPHRLYILHGIYGAGRNWATLARSLAAERPDWAQILVDLRLHGHSRGFAPPHTLAACAHDLAALAGALGGPPDAVLGHSFGGKVALLAAAALRPAQVWVIDSTPSRRSPGGSAHRMLGLLRRLPRTFPERTAAVSALEREGLASHVALWMATNLAPVAGGYAWTFALDDMQALLDDFFRTDLWEVVESPPAGTMLRFVKASGSDVMSDAEAERARTLVGEESVHTLRGGHWLHVDNPVGLLGLLTGELGPGTGA